MPNPVQIGSIAPSKAELQAGSMGVSANEGRMLGNSYVEGLNVEQSFTGGEWIPDNDWCVAYKPDGSACKARPLTGTNLCVGHTKQAKAQEAKQAEAKRKVFEG